MVMIPVGTPLQRRGDGVLRARKSAISSLVMRDGGGARPPLPRVRVNHLRARRQLLPAFFQLTERLSVALASRFFCMCAFAIERDDAARLTLSEFVL